MENFINLIRVTVLKAFRPFIIWAGEIQTHQVVMPDKSLQSLLLQARPGDVLICHRKYALSNLGIPGFWKHAALFGNSVYPVIEATGKGVVSKTWAKWLYSYDYVMCLRPTFLDKDQAYSAVIYAASQVGKPYDYDFSPGIEAFYCSELVYWAYKQSLPQDNPFTLRKTFGVDTVVPEDFEKAVIKGKFEIVWDSRKQ